MATVTGTLTDIGLGHLVGKSPEVFFTLNAPNAWLSSMYPTEPIRVVPNASTGFFSVDLVPTVSMNDTAYYTLSVRWLATDGPGGGARTNWDGWEIQVPAGGGTVSGLWGKPPTNTRMVYVSLTAPEDPKPFTLWLEQNPYDVADPANTGRLYGWENV